MRNIDKNALVRLGEIISYLQTDRYMDKADAAQYLGVSVRTLESWGVPKYRPSGKVLYRKSEIDAFMERHR